MAGQSYRDHHRHSDPSENDAHRQWYFYLLQNLRVRHPHSHRRFTNIAITPRIPVTVLRMIGSKA